MYIKNVEKYFLLSEEEERRTIMSGCGKMFYCTKYFVEKLRLHLDEDNSNQLLDDENTHAINNEKMDNEEDDNFESNLRVGDDKQLMVDVDLIKFIKKPSIEKEDASKVNLEAGGSKQKNLSVKTSCFKFKGLCDDSLTDYSSEDDCSSIYIPQIAGDSEYLKSVEQLSFNDFSRGLNVELDDSKSFNGSHACFTVDEIDLQKQQCGKKLRGLCNTSFTDYSSCSEHCETDSSLKSIGSCENLDLLIANVEAHEAVLDSLDKELECSESYFDSGSSFYLDEKIFTKQKFSAVYKWVEQINKSFLFDTIESCVEPFYNLIGELCDLDSQDDKRFDKQQKFLVVLKWVETVNNVTQIDPIETFVENVIGDDNIKSKKKSSTRRFFS